MTASDPSPDLLPVRMLNEYAYCPRLFHLMHVEGRWEDNQYTIEGRHVHRRVDQLDHLLPDPGAGTDADAAAPGQTTPAKDAPVGDEPPVISRSVPLSSAVLGLSAKLDLVSSDGTEAVPVDTKRGRVPNNPERSWEPERVQLMAQGLLLREHGYLCDHGILYFAGSRTRVTVPFTPELEQRTRELIEATHRAAALTVIPDPLEDSPKCNGCSLAGICMPDETLALRHAAADTAPPLKPRHTDEDEHPAMIRRLYPPRPDATPFYVQHQGAYVGKKGNSLFSPSAPKARKSRALG